MGLIADLASRIGIDVFNSGNMELVAATDLVRFLEVARECNLRVLGLEGFRMIGSSLVPDMGAIADFSSIEANVSNWETVDEARRFLSGMHAPDLFYEVTFS